MKRKHNIKLIVLSLTLMALLLAACGSQSTGTSDPGSSTGTGTVSQDTPDAAEQTVKDAMGHEVKIPAHPQKVLAAYLEDHLVAIGVKPVAQWAIGTTVQKYLTSELNVVPTIEWNLPPEAVAAAAPDLIIVGSQASVQKGLYEQYSKIAPTYVLGDEILADWRKALTTIGELLNKSDEAAKAIQDYDQKAADAKEKIHQAIGDQSAAILWQIQQQLYIVEPTRTSGNVLYGDLGVKVPALVASLPAPGATWEAISLEKLADLDADHIFLINADGVGQAAKGTETALWKNLKAVKEGHVHELADQGNWTVSGLVAGEKTMEEIVGALTK
ncbi:ABC transporter substrate-binding protein [Paenibacillus sp. JX-17]|uniref:ABC transporter substrate-binding protein n=1 Tax=Paenibacillus lacisoli TaxID=3064525 RepID=A0ABT9CG42_9BACL|nr:ABC transporter substrate-binding protein [Paenibacillus sp. JX-17]MDO7908241.1 ABC transporter substrate-binding protein [Paenibacillus sp. JX-17]